MDILTLKAEKRNQLGRKVKGLRKEGVVPANVFGKKIKSESIQIKLVDFNKIFKETGETNLLELHINGDKKPVLVHNIQKNPVTEEVLHVDFLQVNLKEKVTAEIPIELIGESPAEKQALGTLVQHMDEVEVEALPTDLPEKFEIDVSFVTQVDQVVCLGDIKVDKGKVEIKEDLEKIVLKIEPLREEKEEVKTSEEVSEEDKDKVKKEEETQSPEEEKTERETSQS